MEGKKGNRAFLEALQAEGVCYLFGNPGSSEVPWLDLLPEYPSLRHITVLHEDIGVAMADGYALASGNPGVVSLHTVPGTAHGLCNLFNAHYSGTPLVALVGQQLSRLLNRDSFLGADIVQMARPWVKWAAQVSSADEIAYGVHRAFKEATDPPTGPVLLSIPRDFYDETVKDEIPHAARRSLGRKVRPDSDEVQRAAELFLRAESPALLCGPLAERSGSVPLLLELVDLLAIRVYDDTFMPSCFPTTHRFHLGLYNKEVAERIDLLLVVGQPLLIERKVRDMGFVPPGLSVVQIDSDPRVIAKNHPVEAGLFGHPRLCVEELLAKVRELAGKELGSRFQQRARLIEKERTAREGEKARDMEEQWDRVPISSHRLVAELRRALEPDAIVVDETTTTQGYLRRFFEFPEPGLNYYEVSGGLGWGLPAALGVKLARPKQQVVAFVGDGSFLYYPQALWTACRYNLPVLTVICNNHAYLNDKMFLHLRGGPAAQRKRYEDVEINNPDVDFVRCAESMGAYGERVERPEELAGALRRALGQERPSVVDVEIDPWQWGAAEK